MHQLADTHAAFCQGEVVRNVNVAEDIFPGGQGRKQGKANDCVLPLWLAKWENPESPIAAS